MIVTPAQPLLRIQGGRLDAIAKAMAWKWGAMMIGSGTTIFSTGMNRAVEFRRQLLDALAAESQWCLGNDRSATITWMAGPLATRFMIEPVDESVPGLAVLHVFTTCATVDDVHFARATVDDLNFHTSFGRWSILNDPELTLGRDAGWEEAMAGPLMPLYDPESVCTVSVGISLVVGDSTVEFPLAVARQIVAGTIAKATAVTTNDFYEGWGSPAIGYLPDGSWRSNNWNRVVHYFDDEVNPYRDKNAGPRLSQILTEAFTIERDLQFRECPAAWNGSGGESGFTCEVPYGPGPYPMGFIGVGLLPPELAGPESQTSLVRGIIQPNPHLGSGLVFVVSCAGTTVESAVEFPTLPEWMTCALLNAQNRLRHEDATPGFTHAVGAWVPQNGISHVSFIPSAWAYTLDRSDLLQFFRVMLGNAARLAWGSRMVLQPFRDRDLHAPHQSRSLSGLAAGSHARGRHFGEPGVGLDSGARCLGFAWDNLVGGDTQYASTFTDAPGFRFWMGPNIVDITSQPCDCRHESGSLVLIETDLGDDSYTLREAVAEACATGWPCSIASIDGRLIARAKLHSHENSLHFTARWTVPLAAALGHLADLLPPAEQRGVDLSMPSGELRHDRDDFLGNERTLPLWDADSEWRRSNEAQSQKVGLLHAQMLAQHPGFDIQDEDDQLVVKRVYWWMVDGKWRYCSLTTACAYVEHAVFGRSLRLETCIPLDNPADPYELSAVIVECTGTELGGFVQHENGTVLSTLYPLALDASREYAGQVSFAGTALQHHIVALQATLPFAPPATDGLPSASEITTGIQNLMLTYQSIGDASPQLKLSTTRDGGETRIEWSRDWPYSDFTDSPLLATYTVVEDTPLLVGGVLVAPEGADPWPFRLAHSVLALSAPLSFERGDQGSLLESIAYIPDYGLLSALGDWAVEDLGLLRGDDGEIHVLGGRGESIAELQFELRTDHDHWGTSIDVVARLSTPGNTRSESPHDLGATLVIGGWGEKDGRIEYRISLPSLLFACLVLDQPRHELELCTMEVVMQARRYSQL